MSAILNCGHMFGICLLQDRKGIFGSVDVQQSVGKVEEPFVGGN